MKNSLKKIILDEKVIKGTLKEMRDMGNRRYKGELVPGIPPLPLEIGLFGADLPDLSYCKTQLDEELSAAGLSIPVCIGNPSKGNYSVNVGYYIELYSKKVVHSKPS